MKKIIYTLLLSVIIFSSCSTSNVKVPEYREIKEVRLIEIGLLQSKAGIDLVYYNPNNFNVQLTEASGDIFIDSVYFGRFELGEKVQVNKKSDFTIPAIVKLDMIGVVKNHRDLLNKKEALFRIDGFARVKRSGFSREVPIKYERVENIEKFRSLIAL
jgi:LEA14-like dessication related protein